MRCRRSATNSWGVKPENCLKTSSVVPKLRSSERKSSSVRVESR